MKVHCNVSVLHHTGKCTAMSSDRIACDSFCYCLRPKEMHSPVERTSKKVHSIVERTSPHNKTEPLSGQKWTSRHRFFACPMYFEGNWNLDTTAVHFIFMLFCIVQEHSPPRPATTQNTYIHTKPSWAHCTEVGMASTATSLAGGLQTQGYCTVKTKPNLKKQQDYAWTALQFLL